MRGEHDAPLPPTLYAESDGLSIAYQVFGSGARGLVIVPGIVSHLEMNWQWQGYGRLMRQFGACFRIALYPQTAFQIIPRLAPQFATQAKPPQTQEQHRIFGLLRQPSFRCLQLFQRLLSPQQAVKPHQTDVVIELDGFAQQRLGFPISAQPVQLFAIHPQQFRLLTQAG